MAISKKTREVVFQKHDGHCAYCGKSITYKEMQVDHMWPVHYSEYWKLNYGIDCHNISNLMPSCRSCNHYKRGEHLEGFRKLMSTLHERIQKDYISKVAIDYGIIEIKPFSGVFYFESKSSTQPHK